MEFGFSPLSVLRTRLSIWNSDALAHTARAYLPKVEEIIDVMGRASSKAQGLGSVITTAPKLKAADGNNLYILADETVVIGIIKVGRKKLFIRNEMGTLKEINPLCILDFYVHESMQRSGYGKFLFETVLEHEKVEPHHLGYDRPSPKFIAFLAKHYGLKNYVPQENNFVVFKKYFEAKVVAKGRADNATASIYDRPLTARKRSGAAVTQQQPSYPQQAAPTYEAPSYGRRSGSRGSDRSLNNSYSSVASTPSRHAMDSSGAMGCLSGGQPHQSPMSYSTAMSASGTSVDNPHTPSTAHVGFGGNDSAATTPNQRRVRNDSSGTAALLGGYGGSYRQGGQPTQPSMTQSSMRELTEPMYEAPQSNRPHPSNTSSLQSPYAQSSDSNNHNHNRTPQRPHQPYTMTSPFALHDASSMSGGTAASGAVGERPLRPYRPSSRESTGAGRFSKSDIIRQFHDNPPLAMTHSGISGRPY